MQRRSWLIVPGDNEKKLAKALATGADAIVVDLEASVPFPGKRMARERAAEWLAAHRMQVLDKQRPARWVRINSLESRSWRDDVVAVMRGAPDGIILPKASGAESVRQLAAELYEQEERNRIPAGSTKVLPQAGETPRAAMAIGEFMDTSLPRLAGLAWSADGLAVAMRATRMKQGRGGWGDAFGYVRAQVLLVAQACGLTAIETHHANYADEKGLKIAARDARADGFSGMFAIHPAQIASINAAFAPSEEDLDEARRIVAAFEDNLDGGIIEIDRRSIDQKQLRMAREMLGLNDQQASETLAQRAPIFRSA